MYKVKKLSKINELFYKKNLEIIILIKLRIWEIMTLCKL